MSMSNHAPCALLRDRSILLACAHPRFEEARAALFVFAEPVKSPEHYHTYRITPLSLWNAVALGYGSSEIAEKLRDLCGGQLPPGLESYIAETAERYGRLALSEDADEAGWLRITADSPSHLDQLETLPEWDGLGLVRTGPLVLKTAAGRGKLKRELAKLGFPLLDRAGYRPGEPLEAGWQPGQGSPLRRYQQEAIDRFEGAAPGAGSGVVVLPCGAGKTLVGIAALERLGCETLILTSSTASVSQWKAELLARTTVPAEKIGEYSGERREVKPVTVATYHMLIHRASAGGEFVHMGLFESRRWGLVIYDEVHLLPAPVFRATADIQATRRLGLTATLVREDGRETDVFSLIGPKLYELPWKELEQDRWIAAVRCAEISVPMGAEWKDKYRYAGAREKFRLASVNPDKLAAVRFLLNKHKGKPALVIGQYVGQLAEIAAALGVPLITGATPQKERMALYRAFNEGKVSVLAVSKVANFAVNLPDAAVAIEVSGAYGSRQEEAQRLGRILRPKSDGGEAYFYALVTENSREQEFASKRRLFLAEQGYRYDMLQAEGGGFQ